MRPSPGPNGVARALALIETATPSASATAAGRQAHIDALKRREIRERPRVDAAVDEIAETAFRRQAESERGQPGVDVRARRHRVADAGDRHHEGGAFQLLTVNVAVARRVADSLTPCQVIVNEVFPFTKTLVCADPGMAEARMSENTETVIRSSFINIPIRVLTTSTFN